MAKFELIDEDSFCPICSRRLFYCRRRPQTEMELSMDCRSFPYVWYCTYCDRNFKKCDDEVSLETIRKGGLE
jgi:hypothetical protein